MNIAQIIAIVRVLIANKESIIELIKLLQSIFDSKTLIGSEEGGIVYDDSAAYPSLAAAVSNAHVEWPAFVQWIIENADEIKSLVKTIIELFDLFDRN